jgi:hypothetical protein
MHDLQRFAPKSRLGRDRRTAAVAPRLVICLTYWTLLAIVSLAAGCAQDTGSAGNTELNVVVPNGAPSLGGGSSAPASIDIVTVEYTITCAGNSDTFLDNAASFLDEVRIDGDLEVVDGRTSPQGLIPPEFGTPRPGDGAEIWQGFMDLPPGACSVELRARDDDGEVICTAIEPFIITADTTTKVNLVLICDVSFQAPVGTLDVDATFSFNVGNFCPDLFVLNCYDSDPTEQQVLPPPNPPLAATGCEVRFRDGDSTCGPSCDPQVCTPTATGLSCVPGPDPGVSTTITCNAAALLDCEGDGIPDGSCTINADTLGTLPEFLDGLVPCVTAVDCGVPDAACDGGFCDFSASNPNLNANFFLACVPPALGGIPGATIVCTAETTDGDLDCNKIKIVNVNCPGLPPCDPSLIDCDDGNDCTEDSCDPSSGVGVCINNPSPAGTACIVDPVICATPFPSSCDGAGTCSTTSCISDAACDDGNACTVDLCEPICGLCELPSPEPDGTSCDAGLGSGSGECVAGACAGICGVTTCPDNGIPCVTDVCDPVDGSCVPVVDADGSPCDPPGGTPGTGFCDDAVCAALQYAPFCLMPLAFEEPLCNPTYDDTLWPGSHRGSYAQGSAAGPGPAPGAVVTPEHVELAGAPIIASFSEPYADGGRAVWATILGIAGTILKLDHDTFQIIDEFVPTGVTIPLGVSGAYNAIDSAGNFIVARTDFISVYGDSIPGDRFSPIELKRRVFVFPNQALCNSSDFIAGMSLTYDGHIAFVTELGNVFVIPVDAEQADVIGSIPVISTNPNCATADPATLELVSNNIATDENGGIYVVTSGAMYRFDWDGTSLSQAWRVPYDSDPNVSPIRLGPGSGQTPSLMGTKEDADRFVVIADGQALMNLLVMWRDDIPPGWQPIAPGKDPRIACEVPIRFGDPSATLAISEQSIAVRGYASIVVSDVLTNPTIVDPSSFNAGVAQNLVSALEGGQPAKAPVGMERVDWDPLTQTCSTIWANPTVSIPNGIPSISEETRLVYGIGQRGGQWGVEALDFDTGNSLLWAPGGTGFCDPALIAIARSLPAVDALLDEEVVPGSGVTLDETSCENSVYAATTVGPDGSIYTGTFFGMSKYSPDVVPAPSESVRAHAGVDQALDLLARAQTAFGVGGPSAARDFVGRAYKQVSATVFPAQVVGPPAAYNEVINAAASVNAAFTQIEASQDPSANISQAIVSLTNADALLN